MTFFDENGLTGNSGFVPGGHVSANYSAGEGNVFICQDDYWIRMKKTDIEPTDRVVRCRQCDNPAISIDHSYPYYSDGNYCEDHKPK